jgi:hypothetical protein
MECPGMETTPIAVVVTVEMRPRTWTEASRRSAPWSTRRSGAYTQVYWAVYLLGSVWLVLDRLRGRIPRALGQGFVGGLMRTSAVTMELNSQLPASERLARPATAASSLAHGTVTQDVSAVSGWPCGTPSISHQTPVLRQ